MLNSASVNCFTFYRKALSVTANSKKLLILQCDARDSSNRDLIACARYNIENEFNKQNRKSSLDEANNSGVIHVVFIIQLPRIAGGCFSGFQVWLLHEFPSFEFIIMGQCSEWHSPRVYFGTFTFLLFTLMNYPIFVIHSYSCMPTILKFADKYSIHRIKKISNMILSS